MAITTPSVGDVCARRQARRAALAATDSATRDAALHAIADALEARTPEILEANARDMEAGREAGLTTRCSTGWRSTPARIARDRRRGARQSRRCPTRSAS